MAAGIAAIGGCAAPPGLAAPGLKLVLEQVFTDAEPAGPVVVASGGAAGAPSSTSPDAPAAPPLAVPAPGGGPAGAGQPAFTGRILDEVSQPVAGATVLFASGGTGTTGADGRFSVTGAPGGGCFVSAPGYVTSAVVAGDMPSELHLRRVEPGGASFDSQEVVIRGSVTWPAPAHLGGAVYYRDDHGSLCDPVVVDAEGLFALRVRTQRAGRPRGVVLALAAGPDDTPMIGLSPSFDLMGQAATPVEVPIVLADRTIPFAVGAPPAGLPTLRSRLELTPPGMSPFHLDGEALTSGRFQVPAPGALPATVRIAVEAANDQLARSVVAMDPEAMPATPPAFLALPTLTVNAAAKSVAWSGVSTGQGVVLQLRQAPRLAEAYWEGWLENRSERVFEAAQWPTAASAIARLVAFDSPEATARRVASARSLRLLPHEQFQHGYRLAECQVPFTP